MKESEKRTFLIFNTASFGDVLLCNTLCQNIKIFYPNSRVVFIVDKPFYEAAKYQKDVDEVIIYDKNGEHKSIQGFFKFLKNFKYYNPFCAFLPYRNVRNYLISFICGAKHIISEDKKLVHISTQMKHAMLLEKITKKHIKNLPISYCVDMSIPVRLSQLLPKNKKIIAFCPVSKDVSKDIPIKTSVDIINKLRNYGYEIIFCGAGEKSLEYSRELKKSGCNFIDLTNKTSIFELAAVLKNCNILLSVDTGTMHLGCAVKTKTIVIFYKTEMIKEWGPDPELYNAKIINTDQTAENICSIIKSQLEKSNV